MAFDGEKAMEMMKELRTSFSMGKTRSYDWRVKQLNAIDKMIDENEEDLMEALHSYLSKCQVESFIEISSARGACNFFLKNLKRLMAPEKVSSTLTTFLSVANIVPEPLGVVLVISAWNYPFLLSLEPVIGAIAAGNAVVLKPSEIAPSMSSLLTRIFPDYVDNSCVRVVEGAVAETTALLDQKWDKIFYTGNGKVGRIVLAAAVKLLTPVVLELGGKCPLVVDSDIDLQVAARRIVAGKWGLNNGQTCVAADYVITTKSFAPKLVDALKFTLEEFYGENPLDTKDLSRIVNSNHFLRLSKLLDDDMVSGKIVHGGYHDEKQLKIAPTLLLDVPDDSLVMKEEIFDPLLPIMTVHKIEDSLAMINSRTKPLAAYLFTKNKNLERMFVEAVSSGGMLINDIALHLTNHNLPFGGVGESGTGSYHGKFSFDAFSHKKAVLSHGFGREPSLRYPPYTAQKQRFMRAVLSGNIIAILLALIGLVRS